MSVATLKHLPIKTSLYHGFFIYYIIVFVLFFKWTPHFSTMGQLGFFGDSLDVVESCTGATIVFMVVCSLGTCIFMKDMASKQYDLWWLVLSFSALMSYFAFAPEHKFHVHITNKVHKKVGGS